MSETTTQVSDYNGLMHFAAITSLRSSQFKAMLVKGIQEGRLKYVPVYAQEYPAYLSLAMLNNPALFNAINDQNLKNNKGVKGQI